PFCSKGFPSQLARKGHIRLAANPTWFDVLEGLERSLGESERPRRYMGFGKTPWPIPTTPADSLAERRCRDFFIGEQFQEVSSPQENTHLQCAYNLPRSLTARKSSLKIKHRARCTSGGGNNHA